MYIKDLSTAIRYFYTGRFLFFLIVYMFSYTEDLLRISHFSLAFIGIWMDASLKLRTVFHYHACHSRLGVSSDWCYIFSIKPFLYHNAPGMIGTKYLSFIFLKLEYIQSVSFSSVPDFFSENPIIAINII